MSRQTWIALLLLSAFVCPPAIAADEAKSEVEVTRADLALSYLRFEQAMQDHDPPEDRIAELSKTFDTATMQFFRGQNAESVQGINDLTARVDDGELSESEKLAYSLKVIPESDILVIDDEFKSAAARVVSMYPVTLTQPTKVDITVLRPDMSVVQVFDISAPAGEVLLDQTINVAIEPIDKPRFAIRQRGAEGKNQVATSGTGYQPGRYAIVAGANPEQLIPIHFWPVATFSPEAKRKEIIADLDKLGASHPDHADIIDSLKARALHLTNKIDPKNSAQFLADPTVIASELDSALSALRDGKNPYKGRTGDYWRTIPARPRKAPVRIYAPATLPADTSVPLVVVLHGMGGDENMFMDAYGNGEIKRQADKHNFVVASPLTSIMNRPENFDTLVETLAADYNIDRNRIYVAGHSMGGGATAGLAIKRPDKIAAAAVLAGSPPASTATKLPPTLVIAAEFDGVVPAARIEPGAKKAIDAGLPVEYRLQKNFGHTTVVGHVLPDAIDWMLEKKLNP